MIKRTKHLLDIGRFHKRAGQAPGEIKDKESASGVTNVILKKQSGESEENPSLDSFIQEKEPKEGWMWIDIVGLSDITKIKDIGEKIQLHPLVLEDIVNEGHLPKFEFSKEYKLFILKYPHYDSNTDELKLDHVGLVLKDNLVATFQEGSENHYDPIMRRLGNTKDTSNAEYLFYRIIDFTIDQYFLIMDYLRNSIENMEDLLMEEPNKNQIHEIQRIKKRIVILRRQVNFLKTSLGKLLSKEVVFQDESIRMYFTDVYDHIIHVSEVLETAKDMQVALLELNISNVNNSMNRVMKTLTIVATIFIPLTFVAGIYGMNFKYMPELEWEWGYPAILAFMLILAALMIWYIRRKGWF
jgi:magnesium transporter